MRFARRLTKVKRGSIFSLTFQFTDEEMAGAFSISDQPHYTSVKALEKMEEPQTLLSFLRQFVHMVYLFNHREKHPVVIEAMLKRRMGEPHNKPRNKRRKKKKPRIKLSKGGE